VISPTAAGAKPFLPMGKAYRSSGWELFKIYLLPEYVGRGIGKELLHRREGFLQERDARSCRAYMHLRNKLARRFYFRNGLKRAKELDRWPTSVCFANRL